MSESVGSSKSRIKYFSRLEEYKPVNNSYVYNYIPADGNENEILLLSKKINKLKYFRLEQHMISENFINSSIVLSNQEVDSTFYHYKLKGKLNLDLIDDAIYRKAQKEVLNYFFSLDLPQNLMWGCKRLDDYNSSDDEDSTRTSTSAVKNFPLNTTFVASPYTKLPDGEVKRFVRMLNKNVAKGQDPIEIFICWNGNVGELQKLAKDCKEYCDGVYLKLDLCELFREEEANQKHFDKFNKPTRFVLDGKLTYSDAISERLMNKYNAYLERCLHDGGLANFMKRRRKNKI